MKIDDTKLDIVMTKLNIGVFTKSQWRFLKEFTDILSIIADALNNLQGNKCPYAVVLPTLFNTNGKLNEMKASNTLTSCKPLISAVMSGFNKRFSKIMNFNDEMSIPALIATVSHPFFKLRWLKPELCTMEQVEKIINIMTNAADEIFIELSEKYSANNNAETGLNSDGTTFGVTGLHYICN